MTLWLIGGLALLTYLSRVASLVLLPHPSPRVERVVMRVPAPLFAGFAVNSLVTSAREPAPAETLAAVLVAAAVATRSRSLLAVLTAGLSGYLVVTLVRALA
jgi:branched-subunit amino acid transport protein